MYICSTKKIGAMKYNCLSHITKLTEVVNFFEHLLYERGVSFHPDDDFAEYVIIATGKQLFTDEEIDIYNRLMQESFDVCEKTGVEIYSIGLASMRRLIDPSVDDEILPGDLVRVKDGKTVYQVDIVDNDQKYHLDPIDVAGASICTTRSNLWAI